MEEIANDAIYESDEIIGYEDLPKRTYLPSVQEWGRANEYFRDHLPHITKSKMSTKQQTTCKIKSMNTFLKLTEK